MALCIAVLLVSAVSITGISLWSITASIANNSVDLAGGSVATPTIGSYSGGFSILVVGADNDKAQGDQYGKRDATLNDVNILLHVADDHQSAVAVSFPRDLVIQHPECTDPETGRTYGAMSAQPLNEAWSRGGLSCVAHTVSQLTDMEIPFAAKMNFNGVARVTDAIGGVPVCLTAPLRDPYIDGGFELPAGYSEISGDQALNFLRSRHGIGDGSDLSRIASQQQYMSSLLRKLKSAETLSDLPTVYSLAKVVADNVTLSSSLTSIDTMVAMARALNGIDLSSVTFVQYPGTTGDPRYPNKVVPVRAAADELFEKIRSDEAFALPEVADRPGSVVVTPEAPTTPTTPVPEAAAPPAVIDGLTGSTAAQETCAVPFGR